MRIRYKSISSGPQGSFQPGDEREIDQREGEDLVRGGYAVDITPATIPVREQAVVAPAVEQAVGTGQPEVAQPGRNTTKARPIMGQLVVVTQPTTEPVTLAEAATHCRIDEANQEPAPSAPTAALASPAAPGNVDNGAHRYLVTYVTADGETQAGVPSAAVTVADKTVNGQVAVTAIRLGGASVTARKLYRTIAGGSTYLHLATIADNTTTSYTDNVADASLGVGAQTVNTTGDPMLNMLIQAARQHAETYLKRYIITQTVELHLDHFPCWGIDVPPLQSVTSIKYYDTDGVQQTLAADQYLVDAVTQPSRITPAFGLVWPSTQHRNNAVIIRFVAGYGAASAVPACIKNWILIRVKTLWDQRDQNVKQLGMPTFEPAFVDSLLDPEAVRSYS